MWGSKVTGVCPNRTLAQSRFDLEMPMATPRNPSYPAPPERFESWLEYAVASFDARSEAAEWIFDDDDYRKKIDGIRKALWAEFNDLRARACLPPWQPPTHQLYEPDTPE
jgi:hypothetical protein